MEAPRVHYARSGDVSIAYGVVGDGPFDLVFVGGWVLSAFETAWDGPARDTLSALSQFSRLILFDKRGTGLSDRDAGVPDLERRMDDIRAVMDAVGSRRAAIMGVSEGGPMTLLFAATYPERTAAAILYGTGASHTRADDYPWAWTPEEWDQALTAPDIPAVGSDEWLDKRLRDLSPSIADDPEARSWWRKWVLMSASPGAVRALTRMNRGADVRHVLHAITVPTPVLHPVGDPTWLLAEGRYIAERIPGAEMVELPGTDHGWWVRPDELARESRRFLSEIWDSGDWDEVEHNRVLATVMFTDIVGSTEKLAEVGDREWKALLQRHHALVRR
jgi:pimeloyl-ACP methyl ester carboxylesterase